jgi:ribonuclease HI
MTLPSLHIFTDGACRGNHSKLKNQRRASWAAIFMDDFNHLSKAAVINGGMVTNNMAELSAIKYVLHTIKENELPGKCSSIEIHTDSDYSLKCITVYAPKWKKMGWTKWKGGGAIKNLSLIKECFNLMQEFGPLVKMSWTKGHSTETSFEAKGNRQADEAANKVLD